MSPSHFTSNTNAPDCTPSLFHARDDVSHSFVLFLPLKISVFFCKYFFPISLRRLLQYLKKYFQIVFIYLNKKL